MTDVWYCEPPPPPACEPTPVYCEPPPPPECEPPPPPVCEPPETKVRADNGWGNGIDGDNPGTPKGNSEQAGTKQNIFVSDKFVFKFEGR